MKNQIVLLIVLVSSCAFAQKDNVLGIWLSQEKDGKIEIYKQGSEVFGKLIWLKTPNEPDGSPKLDKHNPKPELRKVPLLGLTIVKNLKYDDGRWTDGTIYDPKSGKTYDSTIFVEDGNLQIRGYIGWFYQTRTWTPSSK